MRGHLSDLLAGKADAAAGRAKQTRNGAQGGGLARAIAAQHGDDLALLDVERNAFYHHEAAVSHMQLVDAKK